MKRTVLNFEELAQEMVLLSMLNQLKTKGGTGGNIDYEWGVDPNGNTYYREVGSNTWTATGMLNTVNIYADRKPTDHITLFAGVDSQGNGYGGGPADFGPGGIGGGDNSNYNGGYAGGGMGDYNVSNKFYTVLNAIGTTASAFEGVMGDVHSLAKLGDFAEDAKELLLTYGKYAGGVALAIDVIITAHDMLKDGVITQGELAELVGDRLIGAAIGSVPFVGGVLGTIYDLSGADDFVEEQMKILIDNYYGEAQTVIY